MLIGDVWLKAGDSVDAGDLAVAVHGFVGDNDREVLKRCSDFVRVI